MNMKLSCFRQGLDRLGTCDCCKGSLDIALTFSPLEIFLEGGDANEHTLQGRLNVKSRRVIPGGMLL